MQQYQQQVKARKALLLFIKNISTPVILYFDNPETEYQSIQQLISKPSTGKLVEFKPKGPIKTFSVIDSQICAVALQEEAAIK